MKRRSHAAQIIDWLATGRSLTPLQALRKFGCLSLSQRIFDLRRAGHRIVGRLVRRGDTHVSQYTLHRRGL